MTSNLASDEIAEHALQLRDEAKDIHDKRSKGKLGQFHWIFSFCFSSKASLGVDMFLKKVNFLLSRWFRAVWENNNIKKVQRKNRSAYSKGKYSIVL